MFLIEQIFPDVIKFALSLGLISLIILRCGGISFLLRLLLRVAGLNFKKGILGKADDEIFYTQKFSFLNGVRVKNTQDAKLITKGLSTGDISRDWFFFTYFFGPLGKKKHPIENYLILTLGIFIIIFTFLLLINLPKEGYANYNYDKTSLEISLNDIIIPKDIFNHETISKGDCMNIVKSHPYDMYRSACEYLVLDDKEKEEILANAIKSWESPRKIAKISFFCISLFFFFCFLGSHNYDKLSGYLLNVKE
ncbi:TPA: hypothetical protein SLG40_001104 [Serratia odorifera]|nr:hypothetical protein [Serratia odorifera]